MTDGRKIISKPFYSEPFHFTTLSVPSLSYVCWNYSFSSLSLLSFSLLLPLPLLPRHISFFFPLSLLYFFKSEPLDLQTQQRRVWMCAGALSQQTILVLLFPSLFLFLSSHFLILFSFSFFIIAGTLDIINLSQRIALTNISSTEGCYSINSINISQSFIGLSVHYPNETYEQDVVLEFGIFFLFLSLSSFLSLLRFLYFNCLKLMLFLFPQLIVLLQVCFLFSFFKIFLFLIVTIIASNDHKWIHGLLRANHY